MQRCYVQACRQATALTIIAHVCVCECVGMHACRGIKTQSNCGRRQDTLSGLIGYKFLRATATRARIRVCALGSCAKYAAYGLQCARVIHLARSQIPDARRLIAQFFHNKARQSTNALAFISACVGIRPRTPVHSRAAAAAAAAAATSVSCHDKLQDDNACTRISIYWRAHSCHFLLDNHVYTCELT